MVIGIFGASCTGKSSIANEIAKKTTAQVYTGKDYLRGARSEAEAKKQFIDMLSSNESGNDYISIIRWYDPMVIIADAIINVSEIDFARKAGDAISDCRG